MSSTLEDRIVGTLLGTAVGDALGLPREGLSRRRAQRLFGATPLRHAFFLGRGLVSDDTEHTAMVALSLLRHPRRPDAFARCLAWQLRWWLLRLPAGIGWTTLNSILRLWIGFPVDRSGVHSAGNGAAMRSAILGVCMNDDDRMRTFVTASSRLTHRHPQAEQGALAVALAARCAARADAPLEPAGVLAEIRRGLTEPRLVQALDVVERLIERGGTGLDLARDLGCGDGVTGWACHTVPVALMCWLGSRGSFRRAVEEVILLGGDSDTTGAIVGAIAGAGVGVAGIPEEWLAGLTEWPLSRRRLERIGRALAQPATNPRATPFWPGYLPRNLLFAALVLAHALRRLLPPY